MGEVTLVMVVLVHGRGGRESDFVPFVKSQRKLRLRRNESHFDLDSKDNEGEFALWRGSHVGG
mgnify:CR=1 FL=1